MKKGERVGKVASVEYTIGFRSQTVAIDVLMCFNFAVVLLWCASVSTK
jgi:hypothetical protein